MPVRLLSLADARQVALDAVGWAAASLVPSRLDPLVVATLARLWRSTKRGEIDRLVGHMERSALLAGVQCNPRTVAWRWMESRAELAWVRTCEPGRANSRIAIELEGREHIEACRSAGRGGVVWFMSFCDAHLLMRALHEAGHSVSHLSVYMHGAPGKSRFGAAVAARVHTRSENRFLTERIVMRNPMALGYAKAIQRRLASNGLVTIRGDAPDATSRVSLPLLGRSVAFAAGAPAMAFASGASLLTAYVSRREPFRYRVVVEPVPSAESLGKKRFCRRAVEVFAERLERVLASVPWDWEAWWWIERMMSDTTD